MCVRVRACVCVRVCVRVSCTSCFNQLSDNINYVPSTVRTDQGREYMLVTQHVIEHRGAESRSIVVGSSVHYGVPFVSKFRLFAWYINQSLIYYIRAWCIISEPDVLYQSLIYIYMSLIYISEPNLLYYHSLIYISEPDLHIRAWFTHPSLIYTSEPDLHITSANWNHWQIYINPPGCT